MTKGVKLETRQISKTYGEINALKEVSVTWSGENIYGLFGRNGAGKTTLLDILTARIFSDAGQVMCQDRNILADPALLAESCCYMPEKHRFPAGMKIKTLLELGRRSYPRYCRETESRLTRLFQLNVNQKYKQLSKGYHSIFRIVLGLSSRAPITIFDEPVLGLDAVSRDLFYQELIQSFAEWPRLIIVSTHLIEESADLFNEAVILHQGQVLRQGPVAELTSHAFYVSGSRARVDAFIENRRVLSCRQVHDLKTAVVEGDREKENPPPGLHFSPLTIQNLFIHLTGGQETREVAS